MTSTILAIISGIIGIIGIILRYYYKNKEREPFNRKKRVHDVWKQKIRKRDDDLTNLRMVDHALDVSDTVNALKQVRQQKDRNTPKR